MWTLRRISSGRLGLRTFCGHERKGGGRVERREGKRVGEERVRERERNMRGWKRECEGRARENVRGEQERM